MSIKYDCYFCEMELDMRGTPDWAICTYNRKEDVDYWMKEPPCEYSDNDCPFYITRERAYNIVRREVEKNENNH